MIGQAAETAARQYRDVLGRLLAERAELARLARADEALAAELAAIDRQIAELREDARRCGLSLGC